MGDGEGDTVTTGLGPPDSNKLTIHFVQMLVLQTEVSEHSLGVNCCITRYFLRHSRTFLRDKLPEAEDFHHPPDLCRQFRKEWISTITSKNNINMTDGVCRIG